MAYLVYEHMVQYILVLIFDSMKLLELHPSLLLPHFPYLFRHFLAQQDVMPIFQFQYHLVFSLFEVIFCNDYKQRPPRLFWHLLVLWDGAGQLDRIVLIREFLAGSSALERPPLEPEQLIGDWRCDHPSQGDNIGFAAGDLDRWIFLPDGGAFLAPAQIDPHQPFNIEALWLSSATRLERISRRYSEHGGLTSVHHQLLTR